MTAFLWHGKIYTSLTDAPQPMIDTLLRRGLLPSRAEAASSGEPAAAPADSRHYDDLTVIDRLGPARAEDLRRRGITTLADLANADRDVVESIEGVSRSLAVAWIAEAQSILEGAE